MNDAIYGGIVVGLFLGLLLMKKSYENQFADNSDYYTPELELEGMSQNIKGINDVLKKRL